MGRPAVTILIDTCNHERFIGSHRKRFGTRFSTGGNRDSCCGRWLDRSHARNRPEVSAARIYRASRKRCRQCSHKSQCTTGHHRQIAIHVHEPARQRARERATIPALAAAQRQRRKVEALFAELKNQIGLRRVRLRRMKHVREQFFLAATARELEKDRFRLSRRAVNCPISIWIHRAGS